MNNEQNTQLSYLYSLLITLISLLGVTQCRCNQTSEPSGKTELEIAANKTLLRAPEREFEVIIKPAEGNYLPLLTGLELKAQFLEQETLGKDKDVKDIQESYLAHKYAADKQIFTTSFMIPLTEYANDTGSELEEEQKELRIPIVLHPANQATKLKVGIELVDTQNNTLQRLEVIWVKNELLITNVTAVETPEGLVNLTLKNTKDIPLETNNLLLNLKSDHGETLLFSQTTTPQATLEALWDHHTTLDPGAKTSPIPFKLTNTTEGQALSNLTITVSQEGGKILVSQTVPWSQIQTKAPLSTQPQAQKEEEQKQKGKIEHPTTLPNLQINPN